MASSAPSFKDVAISAALKAGELLRERLSPQQKIIYKGEVDLATEADFLSQELIASYLSKNFPDHGILAEENLEEKTEAEFLWIIDPLDGTTNYAHGYPIFSISIGLESQREIVLGVVYDPNFDELFVAERGGGAYLNNQVIEVSKTAKLPKSLLATGFPYWTRERPGKLFQHFQAFSMKAQGIRRAGSASLDLCALACGRIDGFWEEGLKPWDTAAGKIIVEEAGGTLSKFDGSSFDIRRPEVVATNGLIHPEMLQVLSQPS